MEITHRGFTIFLSPAKLNLGLRVTGKRPDGYHTLETCFCLIDLFDEIRIQITQSGKISLIEHNQAWPYYKDLVFKAATTLKEISNTNLGANIIVKKTIPSGGGFGGGSSNAATTLIALNHLWQLGLPQDQLLQIACGLGADVPFFIHGKNAYATGIGEILTEIEIPQYYFVLICPKFHLNTKNVFARFKLTDTHVTHKSIEYLLETLQNDLFLAATEIEPSLMQIYEKLKTYGNPAMTGSGSTLFLRFTTFAAAKKVASELQNTYNVYLVKSLNTSPVYAPKL